MASLAGAWVVAAAIEFSSNGVAVMERIAGATNLAAIREAELTGKLTAQEAAWLRLRRQAELTRARQAEMLTMMSAGVAAGGALFLGTALDHGMKLQAVLQSIRNETGATADQIKSITSDLYDIGNRSGMSAIEAGEIWRSVSRMTAGQFSVEQMRQLAPTVADFASMVHFNRPDIDVNAAALTGLQTAHLFRAYTQATLTPLLDKVYRLSGMMGESPDQALRQMSYYEPMFKGLGIDNEQSLAMMALLDRAGFRNKVGTNVRAMMLQALGPLQLTEHAQSGKAKLLEEMGIFKDGKFAFNTPSGGVDFMGVLTHLAQWEKIQRGRGVPASDLAKELYSVFGKQGGTIATLMADPKMVKFLGSIDAYMKDPKVGLAAGIQNRDASAMFQYHRALGNFSSALSALGMSVLPEATAALKAMADVLNTITHAINAHPTATRGFMGLVTLITGAATVRAIMGVTANLLRFIGVLGTAEAAGGATVAGAAASATSAVTSLGTALSALSIPITLLIGWAAILGYDITHKTPGKYGTSPYVRHGGDFDPAMADPGGMISGKRVRMSAGSSPYHELITRLRAPVTIHEQHIHVETNDPLKFAQELTDPRSALYSSTKTHARIPLPTSVKPR